MSQSLIEASRKWLGVNLSPEQAEAFEVYARLLREWNQRFNLTAIRDPQAVRQRHFLDSLSCLALIPDQPVSLVDVGTGAGFPGLALKIARPEIQLTLVESVAKKARFCEVVSAELGLSEVVIVVERAEVLGQQPGYREQFDWAVARAVPLGP